MVRGTCDRVRLLLIAAVLLVAAACAPVAAPPPASPPVEVLLAGNAFSQTAITLPVGGTVRWTNDSAVSHTVTFTDALRIPADNGTFNRKVDVGVAVSRSFPTVGTYFFFCMIHPGMQGQITVGAPSSRMRPY
jgi:plastocyanin